MRMTAYFATVGLFLLVDSSAKISRNDALIL